MPEPNDRDDALEGFAEARQAIADAGLRRTLVYTRVRRWYAPSDTFPWDETGVRGRGVPMDTETEIVPTPRVKSVNVGLILASGGRYQSGDVRIDRITPRAEPSTGFKLGEFTRAARVAGEERHVITVDRSGTPWHVYEGTARLLVPAPIDLDPAIAALNLLRLAYPSHWSDGYAHLLADASTAPGSPATGDPTAMALLNTMRTRWMTHRADLTLHREVDPYPVTLPACTDGQSAVLLLHELLRLYNAHAAVGAVSENEVVEARADASFEHVLIVRPTRRTP